MKPTPPCLLCALFVCATALAQPAPGPVIEMDPYVVTADRVLPEPEHWNYVKVPALVLTRGKRNIIAPGYELISNLNASQTRVLVEDMQLRQFASTTLWPMLTQTLPRTPIYVVVDVRLQNSGPSFFSKINNQWDGEPIDARRAAPAQGNFSSSDYYANDDGSRSFASEHGLTPLDDMNDDSFEATLDVPSGNQSYSERIAMSREANDDADDTVKQLPDGFVKLAVNGGPLAMLVRAGEPRAGLARPGMERLSATMSFELNQFALASMPEKPPHWFSRGMARLLGSTQVSHVEIKFAAARETFVEQNMPSLLTVLKKQESYLNEEARLASVFVHYGLFGENGKYAARFMQFAERLGRGDEPTEQMFKEVFGFGIKRMERELATYSRTMAVYKSTNFTGIPPMPKYEQREATQSEIARVKAEVYISQTNLAKALDELRIAYWRGEREPLMLALLATLEQQIGSEPRARKILKALMALPAPPPQTHIVAARLRLKDILSAKPDGAKLSAKETNELTTLLGGAVTGGMTTEDMCGTLAEIILRSSEPPDAGMVGFLGKAAKRYPRNKTITEAAALTPR